MSSSIPELVTRIREAAINPDRWTDVLGSLLCNTKAVHSALTLYRGDAREAKTIKAVTVKRRPGLPVPADEPPPAFLASFSAKCPTGKPVIEFQLGDEVYGIKVDCPPCQGGCSLYENTIEVRDEIASSIRLNRALLSSGVFMSWPRALLDTLADPGFTLSLDGQVHWANKASQTKAWTGAFKALPGKPFMLADAAGQDRFRAALAQAKDEASGPAKMVNVLQPASGSRALMIMKVIGPLFTFESPWVKLLQDAPQAIAVLRTRYSKPKLSLGWVRSLYDLTAKEAELAIALAQGDTLRAYAERTKVSFETARWHSKRVMQKMDCRSQREILQALLYTNALFSILE